METDKMTDQRKAATSMADRVPEVQEAIEGLSQSAREFFANVSIEILDFAQDNQVTPRELAAALGPLIGGCALTEAQHNPEDNETIDDFLEFAHAALHVGAAHARIKVGWEPKMTNPETGGLETEINAIRERYPDHGIHIEYNQEGDYWAVAVAQGGTYDKTTHHRLRRKHGNAQRGSASR